MLLVDHSITDGRPLHSVATPEGSSIIIIIGTDAPFLPIQLKRLAKRAAMGLARTGSVARNGSGDIFIAFSTANTVSLEQSEIGTAHYISTDINPFFEATVQATEESIINALVAAETMAGIDGHTVYALPHDRLKEVLRQFNRLLDS